MNYEQAIDYLYQRLPIYHRVGMSAYKPSLHNIEALCKALGNPQQRFRSVHIGGTNGKGSVSHMLAAVLQTAGYRTGLYTSPHLLDFRERIRINGGLIEERAVIDFISRHRQLIEDLAPSFFEVSVALAFDHFARQQVDIAVVEVGMGGRLDSTNILSPLLSVITNIGLDHMAALGDRIEKIAGEKAGIIKTETPVIIGEYQELTAAVFLEKARELNAPIHFASSEWEISTLEQSHPERLALKATRRPSEQQLSAAQEQAHQLELQLDLTGNYQKKNIKSLLSAVDALRLQGFSITDQQLSSALSQVKALTGLMGRWQLLGHSPLTICDTGHNEDGIREIVRQIKATPYQRLHIVFGMVNDKEVSNILKLLPGEARYYFCQAAVPRAMKAPELRAKALNAGLKGKAYPSVKEALSAAKQAAAEDDLIFIGGSTFIVAEAL